MSLSLGKVSLGLGGLPRIIAIIERILSREELASLQSKGVYLLEFRLDALISFPQAEVLGFASLSHGQGFGLLITLREKKDVEELSFVQQIDLFHALLSCSYVDGVDIEYENQERLSLLDKARQSQCLLMLSTHDFSQTPEASQMEAMLEEAKNLSVDVVKLAYYANSSQDLTRLADFSLHCSFPHLVWIAMGPWGKLSRLMACFFGSLLVYAFLDRANAPGQFSVDEIHDELLRYHPKYHDYIDTLRSK